MRSVSTHAEKDIIVKLGISKKPYLVASGCCIAFMICNCRSLEYSKDCMVVEDMAYEPNDLGIKQLLSATEGLEKGYYLSEYSNLPL